jgi:hypothetical protein
VVRTPRAQLSAGQSARLRRGEVCRTEPGSLAAVKPGGVEATIYLRDAARLRLHDAGKVTLEAGLSLLEGPGEGDPVQVHTAAVTLELAEGWAEVSVAEDGLVTVKVFAGRLLARTSRGETAVSEGAEEQFGAPRAASGLADEWEVWRKLIEGR